MTRAITDEEWDEAYENSTNLIYRHFAVYLEGHPAKHTILGEAASAVMDMIIEAMESCPDD